MIFRKSAPETYNVILWNHVEKSTGKLFLAAVDDLNDKPGLISWFDTMQIKYHEYNSYIFFFHTEEDAVLTYLTWGDQEL